MSLSENGNGLSAADVAAVMGSSNNGFGWGGDASWLIVLFLFAMMGGWGNNGSFNGGNQYPWLLANNTDTLVSTGFNNANLTSLIGDLQNTITAGQFSDLNRSFATQTAITEQLNGLGTQFANCCCENRLGLADLKYTVATEACADRAAVNDALRDVIAANTASTQRILDQMCQDKIDAKNEKIADLERQLTMANLAASQGAQTARILADNAAQTAALEQYLNPTPIPAYPVANPNCCNNYGYGCGCSGFNGAL